MIHTKSLIRRLAYVPWLLAFGLVLGWAGEAQAQVTVKLDKSSVREEAGTTSIGVTASVGTGVGADTYVLLDFFTTAPNIASPGQDKTGFGSRKGALSEDGQSVGNGR